MAVLMMLDSGNLWALMYPALFGPVLGTVAVLTPPSHWKGPRFSRISPVIALVVNAFQLALGFYCFMALLARFGPTC
jgi:hypothetical protein